jgi:integrase/recombinase XerD
MAKPPVFEDKQINHMLAAIGGGGKTNGYSRNPERDTAIILVLYGYALGITELATITVADYVTAKGAAIREGVVRAEISINNQDRPLYWVNKRACETLDAYLAWRVVHGHGVTVKKAAYRGLDPDSPLFLTDQGKPYALTGKALPSGKISYSCNTLGAHVTKMHSDCGLHGGGAQSARRTFAVKAARLPFEQYNARNLAAIMGISVSAVKRITELDPLPMAALVARVGGKL